MWKMGSNMKTTSPKKKTMVDRQGSLKPGIKVAVKSTKHRVGAKHRPARTLKDSELDYHNLFEMSLIHI